MMKHSGFLLCLAMMMVSSCGESQKSHTPPSPQLIGPCEGCDGIFEYGDKVLTPVDTLPGFSGVGTKIHVTGIVYERDGKTPAENVVLYVYHTDTGGIYTPVPNATGWGRRHGFHRGWVKTGADGRYSFYTIKPGSYPSRTDPAHIHVTLMEPDGKYYWLTDYFFADDSLLTDQELYPTKPRGGTVGVLALREQDGILTGKRDIIVGLNVY